MTGLEAMLVLAALAAGGGALWWRRRRRAEAVLSDLGRALALAADAQSVCWRLERRYTDSLAELTRVRRELGSLIPGRGDTRWELGISQDGSSFDLAILALPVRGPRRLLGRGGSFGYQRLLTAQGDHGVVAYDSFAEDRRNRLRPGSMTRPAH